MKSILVLFGIAIASLASAQEIKFLESSKPGSAKIEQMKWLCGHWIGAIGKSDIEEIWADPKGNQMMGMYRMSNEEIDLYEFMTISEIDGSLSLKIKHFDRNLIGREEKTEYKEFKLVGIEENSAYFDAFTIEVNNDTLSIHLILDMEGERKSKGLFKYVRKSN
ncbi:hypothetical protein HZR84_00575 [Hyphobacterium sp. CCMP332]|nr:hypothetical protein HZR84_00575 [Hyphobacterium sp. CCMP332]